MRKIWLLVGAVFIMAGVSIVFMKFNVLHRMWGGKETIFDRVVSIPKEWALEIPQLPPLCDEIKDLKKGYIEIPGGRLYYEEEGSGVPMVLVNPGPGGTHHFYHPYFSRIKDIARIVCYDARGTGKSSVDVTGATYTIKQTIEDLECLRKALGIEKWEMLGWSVGGFLAECYALTYPERLLGLVLINPFPGLPQIQLKPGRGMSFLSKEEQQALADISKARNEGTLSKIQADYNSYLAGAWKMQGYYKPSSQEIARLVTYEWCPAPGFNAMMSYDLLRTDLEGKFDDFEVPTLLMEAQWDLSCDIDKADLMRKNHPHAQFEYFEKSGHKLFADEPEKFFTLLRAFLEKTSKIQIHYTPKNKPQLLNPVPRLITDLVMAQSTASDKKTRELVFLKFYQRAIDTENEDAAVWKLFMNGFLFDKEEPYKALYALQRYEKLARVQEPQELQNYGHCLAAWRGKMLDILGKRKEAIQAYQQALREYTMGNRHCGAIDEAWLRKHIEVPFTREEAK